MPSQHPKDAVPKELANVEDVFPLSPLQEGILFECLRDPAKPLYVHQLVLDIPCDIDVAGLELAWHQMIERHEMLRAVVVWQGLSAPLQVVHRPAHAIQSQLGQISHPDFSDCAEGTKTERLETWLQRERLQKIDLRRMPLSRLSLIRLDEKRHCLVWTRHHIQLDGWSTWLVISELFAAYAALDRGEVWSPPAPRPYRDFVDLLRSRELGAAEQFWSRRLRSFTMPTELRDAGPTTKRPHAHAYAELRLPRAEVAAVRALARSAQVTLNTVFQAAWALVVALYSSRDDVLFGGVVSGRSIDLDGIEGMVGLFINTLPVRVAIDRQATVRDWLRTLQQDQAEARDFENVSPALVRAACGVPPSVPLFDSVLVFENYRPEPAAPASPLSAARVMSWSSFTNLRTTVTVIPDEEEIDIRVTGWRREPEALQEIAGRLAQALTGLSLDADRLLDTVKLVGHEERLRLLRRSSAPNARVATTALQMFRAQAEVHAQGAAVSGTLGDISYAELAFRAQQCGSLLRRYGITCEQRVAVSVERRTEAVVALLGTWFAGGAYVPCDPQLPPARTQLMLERSDPAVVIGSEGWLASVNQNAHCCLTFDEIVREGGAAGTDTPSGVLPANLAYVMFTSGSTGEPKAVAIEHRQLANYLHWAVRELRIAPSSRVVTLASFAFDHSNTALFGALCSGATLHLIPDDRVLDAHWLQEHFCEFPIDLLKITPSFLRALLDGGATSVLPRRTLVLGGEPCPIGLIARVRELGARCTVINHYGPTETAVACTATTVDRQRHDLDVASIGRPIANIAAHVETRDGELAPIGIVGEVLVGGAGVGRGYLGDPALTAARFAPDPFGTEAGGRVYLTGDLAVRSGDGALHFVGRKDDQLKIRGLRIEPAEVEMALRRLPYVEDAAVVERMLHGVEPVLTAFVVTRGPQPCQTSLLREALAAVLPAAMIPEEVICLSCLPLSGNGKVDRAALREIPVVSTTMQPNTASPIAMTLRRIWVELTGRTDFGLDDHFLEIGGHSLMLLRYASAVERATGQVVPIVRLFAHPTIGALAVWLSEPEAGEPVDGAEIGERARRRRQRLAQLHRRGHK